MYGAIFRATSTKLQSVASLHDSAKNVLTTLYNGLENNSIIFFFSFTKSLHCAMKTIFTASSVVLYISEEEI